MGIVVDSVTKTINGVNILDNVSFSVDDGQIYGLVGPNGAGKTTMIRIMLNIYKQTNGKILIDGIDNNSPNFVGVKNKLGFLLDNLGLYNDLTAWDNVEFFDRIYFATSDKISRHERISQALRKVDMFNERDKKITFFSRGMRLRIALARCFVHSPKYLFLDEPSRGLDLEAIEILRNIILESKSNGATIFISSHDLGEMEKTCDAFGFISKGKLIENAKREDLFVKYADCFDGRRPNLEAIYKKLLFKRV